MPTTSRHLLKPAKPLIITLAAFLAIIALLESLKAMEISVPSNFYQVWLIALLVFIFFILADMASLKKVTTPTIERQLPPYLSLNRWQEVSLLISNQQNNALSLVVYDYSPEAIDFKQLPHTLELPTNGKYLLKYSIKPLQRGHFFWESCELTVTSQWRLWQQRRIIPVANDSHVYPDFTRLFDSNITTIEQWIYYLGVRPKPRRGLGQDFHQLRDFREGDTLRQIDWKATARKKSPIAKEYQDERDQHIIFLLDCGQRMRLQDDQLSHFDHALNASLLLSYVALRQGDAVGLATFGADKELFIKPAKGNLQLNTLLNAVYDIKCTQTPADYNTAVQKLLSKTQRRALVIVISNLRYSENSETIAAFKQLSRYHKVLIASMREEIRDEISQQPINDFDEALTYCGNIHQLLNRNQLHDKLIAYQLPILDVIPKHFGPQLVSHYLSLKRSGAL